MLQGYRKILGAIIIVFIAGVAVIIKGDVPPGFKEILEWVFITFVAGNSVNKLAGSLVEIKAAGAAAVVPSPTVDTETPMALNNLANQNNNIAQGVSIVQELLQLIIRRTQLDKVPDPKV